MTNQSDIEKLAEKMASFDDIKDFQKQLIQSFINTALGQPTKIEDYLGYPTHEKADKLSKMGTLKRP